MSDLIKAFFRAQALRLPRYWILHQAGDGGGGTYHHALVPLTVILSACQERDGRDWAHYSISHSDRLPLWEEFKAGKDVFLGDVYAYQVFPPKKMYVNHHPHVLHLFHCLEAVPLPDFTRGRGTI